MRDYAKVAPQFWIGPTGRKIRQLGSDAQLIALYLITNPHATMLGIYYLPIVLISHETGIPFEGASKALQSLCDIGFCSYEENLEYVWVHQMAYYQISEQLKPNDNRVKSINEAYQSLPDLPFLEDFYQQYQTTLLLEKSRTNGSPFEGAPEGLRSQEQEQEQEQEQKQEQEHTQEQEQETVPPNADDNLKTDDPKDPLPDDANNILPIPLATNPILLADKFRDPVCFIFEHWKIVMGYPDAKLDYSRRSTIRRAMGMGYTPDQICNAISGCAKTPFNMGRNKQGQRHDGLNIILREAEQIERLMMNNRSPPQTMTPDQFKTQATLHSVQAWLDKHRQGEQRL